ncbi:TolC family protein [Sandarakinorhabdus sp. AAP62]|uniref:TolC family protein n=1 Tax=Sandarakinorhabdus sp. AAP62 TaxID=1248916 RepID=UPI00031DF0FE|nr:TolC family protein [Sandarakinorhabdus sp. AAP62]
MGVSAVLLILAAAQATGPAPAQSAPATKAAAPSTKAAPAPAKTTAKASAPLAAADQAWLAGLAARPVVDLPMRLRAAADALPAVGEGREGVNIADAQTQQARSRLFPTLGVDVNSADTVTRDFRRRSTQFESLVPRARTDAIGSVSQLLVDWGATSARIRAGQAAEVSARANYDLARTDALVALLGAWHEAIAANASLQLTKGHAKRLDRLAMMVGKRADAGAESTADKARADAAAAQAQTRLADAQRRDAAANARLSELWGKLPEAPARALPPPEDPGVVETPDVRAARADAEARKAAARAAKSDRLPRVEARVSGSAYDIARDGRPDYDVRATVSMTTRFSTGGAEAARVRELSAAARRAELAATRISAETARELEEAEAELRTRSAALPAQQRSVVSAMRARELFGLRFNAARGTLFDLLAAEREALDSGLSLVDAEIRLDMARWLLLARRGTLLQLVDGQNREQQP